MYLCIYLSIISLYIYTIKAKKKKVAKLLGSRNLRNSGYNRGNLLSVISFFPRVSNSFRHTYIMRITFVSSVVTFYILMIMEKGKVLLWLLNAPAERYCKNHCLTCVMYLSLDQTMDRGIGNYKWCNHAKTWDKVNCVMRGKKNVVLGGQRQ